MEKICKTCAHFRQHYIKRARNYWPVEDGHCVYPRCKLRKPKTPACRYYEKREE